MIKEHFDNFGLDESRALSYNGDTIAAVATGNGVSGIGIVRISGPDAIGIADGIFRGKMRLSDAAGYTIHYGYIYDNDEKIDECLVSVFRAPKSYTTEDVVEINSHGGRYVLSRILDIAVKAGVRPAEAGEFTKRAFLGGRIDLSQAESVMDIIASESELARKNAVSQLSGELSGTVKSLRGRILHETAYIEAALDDPEHISLDGYKDKLLSVTEEISSSIHKLILSADEGVLLKDGIPVVLLGRPNVGKSSLWNRLLGVDKAIVTDVAGTTRDVLEETVRIGDFTLRLCDTAGIRDTDDIVEQIGVERSKKAASDARLIILILDAAAPLSDEDERMLSEYADSPMIVLLNKTDLSPVTRASDVKRLASCAVIEVSALTGEGIDTLRERIKEMFFKESASGEGVIITSARHRSALLSAERALSNVKSGIESDISEEFLTVDLMDAYRQLGTITGEEVGEDLINEIFSSFCMGK